MLFQRNGTGRPRAAAGRGRGARGEGSVFILSYVRTRRPEIRDYGPAGFGSRLRRTQLWTPRKVRQQSTRGSGERGPDLAPALTTCNYRVRIFL
ncbi:hypothetical protein EVAR_31571_1 [Eumeta japonica]|uniref:Uncharacterized protein n=1 Tax=Eumeta variegata TaxID=151549 RepID=A0A4C1V8Q1_EUMVA|nr:hypothetical protein EVAR_31571_1 [Eumeta japonica]